MLAWEQGQTVHCAAVASGGGGVGDAADAAASAVYAPEVHPPEERPCSNGCRATLFVRWLCCCGHEHTMVWPEALPGQTKAQITIRATGQCASGGQGRGGRRGRGQQRACWIWLPQLNSTDDGERHHRRRPCSCSPGEREEGKGGDCAADGGAPHWRRARARSGNARSRKERGHRKLVHASACHPLASGVRAKRVDEAVGEGGEWREWRAACATISDANTPDYAPSTCEHGVSWVQSRRWGVCRRRARRAGQPRGCASHRLTCQHLLLPISRADAHNGTRGVVFRDLLDQAGHDGPCGLRAARSAGRPCLRGAALHGRATTHARASVPPAGGVGHLYP